MDTERGTTTIEKPEVDYYVEVVVTSPDGEVFFRAVMTKATKPTEAEAEAIEDAAQAHGRECTYEVFMSRRLTEKRATKIRQRIESGTWEGWQF